MGKGEKIKKNAFFFWKFTHHKFMKKVEKTQNLRKKVVTYTWGNRKKNTILDKKHTKEIYPHSRMTLKKIEKMKKKKLFFLVVLLWGFSKIDIYPHSRMTCKKNKKNVKKTRFFDLILTPQKSILKNSPEGTGGGAKKRDKNVTKRDSPFNTLSYII